MGEHKKGPFPVPLCQLSGCLAPLPNEHRDGPESVAVAAPEAHQVDAPMVSGHFNDQLMPQVGGSEALPADFVVRAEAVDHGRGCLVDF